MGAEGGRGGTDPEQLGLSFPCTECAKRNVKEEEEGPFVVQHGALAGSNFGFPKENRRLAVELLQWTPREDAIKFGRGIKKL